MYIIFKSVSHITYMQGNKIILKTKIICIVHYIISRNTKITKRDYLGLFEILL